MENKFIVSAAPHVHTNSTITKIMLDVLIALFPAVFMSVVYFGIRAIGIIVTSVVSAVIGEYLFNKAVKKKNTIGDLSAAVTGVLLALNMPPTIPLWMVAIGSLFSIIVVKQVFGGLGKNFMNPALGGRCFMLIAWAGAMTTFIEPLQADAVSCATQLTIIKNCVASTLPSMFDVFIGKTAGCIGETSAAALILGFAYLLVKRVVSLRIPLAYILTFAVLTYFFGFNSSDMSMATFTLYQILSGGLLLGAFFMATDYVTTPTTPNGRVIFGIGCGILTFVIRRFGGYPEGVSFAIILMNLAAPIIEERTVPKPYGGVNK